MTKLEEQKIQPGTYRLTRDIDNPDADRRTRRDWAKVVKWPKGMEVIVEAEDLGRLDVVLTGHVRLTIKPTTHDLGKGSLTDREAGFAALVPALEPCRESLEALFTRLGVPGHATHKFIEWAIENEFIGRRFFEQLYQAWLDDVGSMGAAKLFHG